MFERMTELEKYRIRGGEWGTESGERCGAFLVPSPVGSASLRILACSADAQGNESDWDHASVSVGGSRTPNWREMCFVKDLFWREDEVVMQLHVAKDDHVNRHEYCLHLWRPAREAIPLPPKEMV